MLIGYLGRQALSLTRGILSLNQDRHLCQGTTCSGQGLSSLGVRVTRTATVLQTLSNTIWEQSVTIPQVLST